VTSLVWFHIAALFWIVFLLFWIISARRLKAIKRREALRERLLYMLLMVAAYILLFDDGLSYSALGKKFIQVDARIGVPGVTITAAGVALAIWARVYLGENWSATVTLKTDHELIDRGPYGIVRHPIYAGILVAMAGSALALGQMGGVIAFIVTAVGFYFKAKKEERCLLSEFGEDYRAYSKRTGMLLPKLL